MPIFGIVYYIEKTHKRYLIREKTFCWGWVTLKEMSDKGEAIQWLEDYISYRNYNLLRTALKTPSKKLYPPYPPRLLLEKWID